MALTLENFRIKLMLGVAEFARIQRGLGSFGTFASSATGQSECHWPRSVEQNALVTSPLKPVATLRLARPLVSE